MHVAVRFPVEYNYGAQWVIYYNYILLSGTRSGLGFLPDSGGSSENETSFAGLVAVYEEVNGAIAQGDSNKKAGFQLDFLKCESSAIMLSMKVLVLSSKRSFKNKKLLSRLDQERANSKYVDIIGNVSVKPHIGIITEESYDRWYTGWVDTILSCAKGKLINVVKE